MSAQNAHIQPVNLANKPVSSCDWVVIVYVIRACSWVIIWLLFTCLIKMWHLKRPKSGGTTNNTEAPLPKKWGVPRPGSDAYVLSFNDIVTHCLASLQQTIIASVKVKEAIYCRLSDSVKEPLGGYYYVPKWPKTELTSVTTCPCCTHWVTWVEKLSINPGLVKWPK